MSDVKFTFLLIVVAPNALYNEATDSRTKSQIDFSFISLFLSIR